MPKFIPRVRTAREIYQERRSDNSHLQASHLSHFPKTFIGHESSRRNRLLECIWHFSRLQSECFRLS